MLLMVYQELVDERKEKGQRLCIKIVLDICCKYKLNIYSFLCQCLLRML